MRMYLALAVVLVSHATVSPGEDSSASAGIAARLAFACSDGVRHAVEHELENAQDQSLQITSGQLQTSQNTMSSLQQMLQHTGLAPEYCPAGWSHHENSCYFIPPKITTWYLAHHACAVIDRRARLASLHPASRLFVEEMVASFNASKAVWIGLARLDLNSDWVWSDGTPLDYVNWDKGEPTGGEERCAHMGWPRHPRRHLHDNMCHVLLNVLCQINLS